MILFELYNIIIVCVCIQENRESVEQFFAEYGKAYEQVFNEDDDEEKEEKETGKEKEKWKMNTKQKTHTSIILCSLKPL